MTSTAPSRRHVLANVVVSQAGWLAAVLGAAHGRAAWGTLAVALALAWHLAVSVRPLREAALIALVAALGTTVEWLHLSTGWVSYGVGHATPNGPPYWLVGLWALFATTLNVSLRWLKGRLVLAAWIGAVAGPLAFLSGTRLGAATLHFPELSLPLLALLWALAMPLLLWCAERLDGMAPAPAQEPPHARAA